MEKVLIYRIAHECFRTMVLWLLYIESLASENNLYLRLCSFNPAEMCYMPDNSCPHLEGSQHNTNSKSVIVITK